MEIQASSRFDVPTIQAVHGITAFGRHDPRKRIRNCSILMGVCVLFVLVAEVLMLLLDSTLPPWMFLALGVCVLMWSIIPYSYYIAPKRRYRKMGVLSDLENHYTLRESEMHVVSAVGDGYRSEETVAYAVLHKLMETTDYFFIFIEKTRTYVIDKKTMSAADVDTVRAWISAVLPYTLCHY